MLASHPPCSTGPPDLTGWTGQFCVLRLGDNRPAIGALEDAWPTAAEHNVPLEDEA